jgi:hypothetical protein
MPLLPSSLPEELLGLSWLIGRWAGVGLGQYPTIEDFRFGQEVSFSTDGYRDRLLATPPGQ